MVDKEENNNEIFQSSTKSINNGNLITKPRNRSIKKEPIPPQKGSFEQMIIILKGLSKVSNKGKDYCDYKVVASLVNIHETTVSSILKFFFDIGFLERENSKYRPNAEIIGVISKCEWMDGESEIGECFKPQILNVWFGKEIINYMEIHKEATKDELIRFLGIKAEVEQKHSDQLNKIVKLLVQCNIINFNETNQKYSLSSVLQNSTTNSIESIETISNNTTSINPSIEREKIPINSTSAIVQNEHQMIININFNISIDEINKIDDLIDKILTIKGDKTKNDRDNT